jgi:hemoglobin
METPDPHLTEDSIARLVENFYGQARADDLLGPIFNTAVHDWPAHFVRLGDFWSGIMLGTGRYNGGMLRVHFPLRDRMTPAHIDRWLALWRAATDATMPADIAADFRQKAGRIADSMRLVFFQDPVTGLRPRN